MKKTLSLAQMAAERIPSYRSKEITAITDTNTWKYFLKDPLHQMLITQNTMREFTRYPEVFPEEHLYHQSLILNPKVVDQSQSLEMISEEDEARILRSGKDIGWVDMEQIGIGMELARSRKSTILLTDDWGMIRTVKALRNQGPLFHKYLRALSIKKYIGELHKEELRREGPLLRDITFNDIVKRYRYAA